MKLAKDRHRGLGVGDKVEVFRRGLVIWEGTVESIDQLEVQIQVFDPHPRMLGFVYDEDSKTWKPTFVLDEKIQINKASPGLKIRVVPA